MGLNKFILILLLLIKINQINSQNEGLSCVYTQLQYDYLCDLTIVNPNGLNNFQDISGAHITGKSNSDVNYVNFASGSNTTNIPSIICKKFQNLQYLDIGYMSEYFTEINDYYYANCKNLKDLYFNGYSIEKVYKNAFSENLQLESLVLSSCGLTTLPAYVFPNSGNNLTFLGLPYNKLKILRPEWFYTLKKLERLDLNYNELEDLPVNIFVPLKNLKYLTIAENKLKVLSSKSFFNITKLEDFNFYQNYFLAIDEEFLSHPAYNRYSFLNTWCVMEKPHKEISADDFMECFENYRAWENGCTIGDENGRICKLENDNQRLIETVVAKDEFDLLKKENQDLKSKVDILIIAVQSLQSQVNMLSARP